MDCNKDCQCKHDKRARELMKKYPNYVTPDILRKEIPNKQERRDVFGRMVYLAQCDKNDELFIDHNVT